MALKEPDPGEADARTSLQAMLPRLAEAPHALLGVPPDATRDVLRTSFLRLTKQFHPTKFARFSPDVVRLANEVFLTIKRAYDQLSPGPRFFAGGTGVRSAVRASGTSPPATKPAGGAFIRAVTNVGPPPAPPVARVTTPAARPAPAAPAAKPVAPARPPAPPPATRAAAPAPPPMELEFEAALDLMRRKLHAEARAAFHKLAAAFPNDKRFRAHMHYARGREAEEAGKPDEARAEWQRALSLDPDFVRAKRAVADLAPPAPTGLFSKIFKK